VPISANVRKRVWIPLLKRANVPYRDLYSQRWTFVSLARASGEVPFNVSRIIDHARLAERTGLEPAEGAYKSITSELLT
jgi:hypothetical protein